MLRAVCVERQEIICRFDANDKVEECFGSAGSVKLYMMV